MRVREIFDECNFLGVIIFKKKMKNFIHTCILENESDVALFLEPCYTYDYYLELVAKFGHFVVKRCSHVLRGLHVGLDCRNTLKPCYICC